MLSTAFAMLLVLVTAVVYGTLVTRRNLVKSVSACNSFAVYIYIYFIYLFGYPMTACIQIMPRFTTALTDMQKYNKYSELFTE